MVRIFPGSDLLVSDIFPNYRLPRGRAPRFHAVKPRSRSTCPSLLSSGAASIATFRGGSPGDKADTAPTSNSIAAVPSAACTGKNQQSAPHQARCPFFHRVPWALATPSPCSPSPEQIRRLCFSPALTAIIGLAAGAEI